jgi:hypothetical protein
VLVAALDGSDERTSDAAGGAMPRPTTDAG